MRNILLSLFLLGTALAGTACAQEPEAQARRAAIEAFYPVMIEALGRGDFAQARSLVQRAIAWEPQQAVRHYNLACIEARAGQAGAALAALGRAVALGYADAAHMAQDADLASLHGYDQFRQLLAAAGGNQAGERPPPADNVATTDPGACKTEADFKAAYARQMNESPRDITWQSFKVGKAYRLRTVDPRVIDAYPAYPVTADYTTPMRTFRGAQFSFYVDHHGNCSFITERMGEYTWNR